MAKKLDLTKHTPEDLHKLLEEKQETLRALRFSIAGSKNRNVKLGRTLRKEVARVLTESNKRRAAAAK